MNREELGIPEDGFSSSDLLVERIEELGAETFLETLEDRPSLFVRRRSDAERAESLGWTAIVEAGDENPKTPATGDGECEIGFVAKRPGNPFPAMVTLGRAKTCDLVLPISTVSKIHAYFLKDDGQWTIVDQHSLNKTLLNDEEISAGHKHPLQDGDRIRFGKGPEFTLLSPGALLAKLKPAVNGR